jgi:3-methyl-2-oxobutanoate hydroxymethyltransferase
MAERVTIKDLLKKKQQRQKVSMITAYDFPFAQIADEAGVDAIIVGDSLAIVVQGHDTTLPVSMDEMTYHTEMVTRAAQRAMVIADMPFLSYQVSIADAVMAHIGLTPQTIYCMGGYKVQGRTEEAAKKLIEDARLLESAGAFSIILEAIPADLARQITGMLTIPSIGIGAGPYCDGQVLVMHDVLGLFDRFAPKFVKKYANLKDDALDAVRKYREDVERGNFPGSEHSF